MSLSDSGDGWQRIALRFKGAFTGRVTHLSHHERSGSWPSLRRASPTVGGHCSFSWGRHWIIQRCHPTQSATTHNTTESGRPMWALSIRAWCVCVCVCVVARIKIAQLFGLSYYLCWLTKFLLNAIAARSFPLFTAPIQLQLNCVNEKEENNISVIRPRCSVARQFSLGKSMLKLYFNNLFEYFPMFASKIDFAEG